MPSLHSPSFCKVGPNSLGSGLELFHFLFRHPLQPSFSWKWCV